MLTYHEEITARTAALRKAKQAAGERPLRDKELDAALPGSAARASRRREPRPSWGLQPGKRLVLQVWLSAYLGTHNDWYSVQGLADAGAPGSLPFVRLMLSELVALGTAETRREFRLHPCKGGGQGRSAAQMTWVFHGVRKEADCG
jgi:hypothetical protein